MSKKPHIVGQASQQHFEVLLQRILNNGGKWVHISKTFCITRKERRKTYHMLIETLKLMSINYESPPNTYKIRVVDPKVEQEEKPLFSVRYGYALKDLNTGFYKAANPKRSIS